MGVLRARVIGFAGERRATLGCACGSFTLNGLEDHRWSAGAAACAVGRCQKNKLPGWYRRMGEQTGRMAGAQSSSPDQTVRVRPRQEGRGPFSSHPRLTDTPFRCVHRERLLK